MRAAIRQINLFDDRESVVEQQVRPIEPLYSILVTCPPESLVYPLNNLNSYEKDDHSDVQSSIAYSRFVPFLDFGTVAANTR